MRVVQLLSTDDTSALADMEQGRLHDEDKLQAPATPAADNPPTPMPPDTGRLSTIPEGTDETASTTESLASYLRQSDKHLTQCLEHIYDDFTSPLRDLPELPADR